MLRLLDSLPRLIRLLKLDLSPAALFPAATASLVLLSPSWTNWNPSCQSNLFFETVWYLQFSPCDSAVSTCCVYVIWRFVVFSWVSHLSFGNAVKKSPWTYKTLFSASQMIIRIVTFDTAWLIKLRFYHSHLYDIFWGCFPLSVFLLFHVWMRRLSRLTLWKYADLCRQLMQWVIWAQYFCWAPYSSPVFSFHTVPIFSWPRWSFL